MAAANNLGFLKDRIHEIKSALLYSMSNELVKMPVSIITVLKMDEEGSLWFFVKKPKQKFCENEQAFPARLQFYRKGKPFFMHVSGTAVFDEKKIDVNEFTGLEEKIETKAMQELVLIKLKMIKAEYYEQKQQAVNNNSIGHFFQNIYASLFKPAGNYRPFELNTAA